MYYTKEYSGASYPFCYRVGEGPHKDDRSADSEQNRQDFNPKMI